MANVKAPCQQSLSQPKEKERLCINRVKSLLNMRLPLLGDSFKPGLCLGCTGDATLTFVLKARFWPLSKIWCVCCLNQFDQIELPRNLGCGNLTNLTWYLRRSVLDMLCWHGDVKDEPKAFHSIPELLFCIKKVYLVLNFSMSLFCSLWVWCFPKNKSEIYNEEKSNKIYQPSLPCSSKVFQASKKVKLFRPSVLVCSLCHNYNLYSPFSLETSGEKVCGLQDEGSYSHFLRKTNTFIWPQLIYYEGCQIHLDNEIPGMLCSHHKVSC